MNFSHGETMICFELISYWRMDCSSKWSIKIASSSNKRMYPPTILKLRKKNEERTEFTPL